MNKLTNFFANKKLLIGAEPPTKGKFEKGDLIINTGVGTSSTPMWICTQTGEPGVWIPVGVGTKYKSEKTQVVVSEAVSEVEIGIEFDNAFDTLLVFINDGYALQGIDYTVDEGKIKSIGDPWNENLTNDFVFEFITFKSISDIEYLDKIDINQIEDNSITIDKLTPDIAEAIRNTDPIDLSQYQRNTSDELLTDNKTIAGAINELFQSANSGKQLIADAIGEPVNENDTFQAMSDSINSLFNSLKTVVINAGITVEDTDKFKELIDKVEIALNEKSETVDPDNTTNEL